MHNVSLDYVSSHSSCKRSIQQPATIALRVVSSRLLLHTITEMENLEIFLNPKVLTLSKEIHKFNLFNTIYSVCNEKRFE